MSKFVPCSRCPELKRGHRSGTRCPRVSAASSMSGGVIVPDLSESKKLSVKRRLNDLTEQMADAVDRLSTEQGFQDWLSLGSRLHQYSFSNQILIGLQRPDATVVAGFHTWKGLGRSVKKGEQGIVVQRPIFKKLMVVDPLTGVESEERRVVGFSGVAVFDVAQTEGDPLPQHPDVVPLDGEAPAGTLEELSSFASAMGVSVDVVDPREWRFGDANGVTVWRDGGGKPSVFLRSDLPSAQRFKTLAHELGHAILHDPSDGDSRSYRGAMEAEAETVALLVTDAAGVDSSGYSFGYVAGWTQGDGDVVRERAQRIQKAAGQLIGALPESAVNAALKEGAERALAASKERGAAKRSKRSRRKKAS